MVVFVCSVCLDVGGAGEARGALQRPDPHQHDPLPHQHQAHRVGLTITDVVVSDSHWFGCPGSGSGSKSMEIYQGGFCIFIDTSIAVRRICMFLSLLDPDPLV
jgi:hypothetical protein